MKQAFNQCYVTCHTLCVGGSTWWWLYSNQYFIVVNDECTLHMKFQWHWSRCQSHESTEPPNCSKYWNLLCYCRGYSGNWWMYMTIEYSFCCSRVSFIPYLVKLTNKEWNLLCYSWSYARVVSTTDIPPPPNVW